MLIKEYRIPLPLTVDEYRIAQLYMIQRKSLEDSRGAGSGVEIITNEPYQDGPGGSGQYTFKVYHIASHLPGWLRAVLPASLCANEEAWNAYPYTKTRFTAKFVDKFFIDIETRYFNDAGTQENVFGLSQSELRHRAVDLIDIVNDPLASSSSCKPSEDPTLYCSKITKRGPLSHDWIMRSTRESKPIMCAYKLCKIEFRYWGMQTKVEQFIDQYVFRRMMFYAHRQAWAWQDEWFGLSMEDIRNLERQAQENLRCRMTDDITESPLQSDRVSSPTGCTNQESSDRLPVSISFDKLAIHRDVDSDDEFFDAAEDFGSSSPVVSRQTFVRWSSEVDLATEDDTKLQNQDEEDPTTSSGKYPERCDQAIGSCPKELLVLVFHGGSVLDVVSSELQQQTNAKKADVETFTSSVVNVAQSHFPLLVGRIAVRLVSCPAIAQDAVALLTSLSPYGGHGAAETVLRWNAVSPALIPLLAVSSAAYDATVTRMIDKANDVFNDFLESEEGAGFAGEILLVGDAMGGILAYDALVRHRTSLSRNPSSVSATSERTELSLPMLPEEEVITKSKVVPTKPGLGHSLSNVPTSGNSFAWNGSHDLSASDSMRPMHAAAAQRSRSCSSECATAAVPALAQASTNFEFRPAELFLLGCPLGVVLAHRYMQFSSNYIRKPLVGQVYNLFYAIDPTAARMEPLLYAHFANIPPMNIPRFQRFPLGDGQSAYVVDCVKRFAAELALVADNGVTESLTSKPRRPAEEFSGLSSTTMAANRRLSSVSATSESVDVSASAAATPCSANALLDRWFGAKRIDYVLYSPDGLQTFPVAALPNLFHASFWESRDVVAFILRQYASGWQLGEREASAFFSPSEPTEKWLHRRTHVKVKNVSANHRGNDILVTEDKDQVLCARFMYGSFDVVTLSGERVDVYVMTDPSTDKWSLFGSELTDGHGRVVYSIPKAQQLPLGLYPVKMVVRGDHTYMDMFAAVVPPATECVVFSIDGAFTASVSVSGKDPKVRPGAVDVVRYWQENGYLILYITARPDMQQRRIVSWLARHNFPHGLVFFTDGISTDPLRQKTQYLRRLVSDMQVRFHCGYGSVKDIAVYKDVGLPVEVIFVVGRVQKKHFTQASILTDYSTHLLQLQSAQLAVARAAQGDGRLVLNKGYFNIAGQLKRSVRRCHSFAPRTGKCDTLHPDPIAIANQTRMRSPFRFPKLKAKS